MTDIGVSTWVWTSPLDDEKLETLAGRIAAWGFDVIELPVEQVGDWDPGFARDVVARHGLRTTVCAVMAEGRDLVTDDPDVVLATQDYLRACVDVAATVGSPCVGGPIYAPTGLTVRMSADDRNAWRSRLVERLRPVADHAGQQGVRLAIEPLNRYETSFFNTTDQALDLVEAVRSPAVGVLLDTFHMNIEERDPAGAVRAAGTALVHLQASGTDRGTPGHDTFDWPALRDAVADIGYEGAWCIESFTPDNDAIARAASIWRPLADTQDDIATGGLAFLRDLVG